jgi:ADP-ribosylglycohydrolase
VAVLWRLYEEQPVFLLELERGVRPDDPRNPPPRGTGYVVDCLRSAWWANQRGDFESVVRAAISLGYDTDTTAAVAGGIVGLRVGEPGIPARWLSGLRGKEIVEPLLARLCS